MPHAVGEEDLQAEQDDEAIRKLLADEHQEDALGFLARDLETGEKADDAVDYEDIADDDLAEDEDETNGNRVNGDNEDGLAGLFSDPIEDNFGDLFGDDEPSTLLDDIPQDTALFKSNISLDTQSAANAGTGATASAGNADQPTFRDVDYGIADDDEEEEEEEEEEEDEQTREQRRLFDMSRRDHSGVADVPPTDATDPDFFEQMWPDFEEGTPLRFAKIIPHKRAFFLAKTPLKPPRPIQPTKVNLEIQQDQERSFRLPENLTTRKAVPNGDADERGIIVITDGKHVVADNDGEIDLDNSDDIDEDEMVAGVKWKDLRAICQDWEIPSPDTLSSNGEEEAFPVDEFSPDNEWIKGMIAPPEKKRRTGDHGGLPQHVPIYDRSLPSFDDFAAATAKIARKIVLDMNDHRLLLEEQQPAVEAKKLRALAPTSRRDVRGKHANPMKQRFNISNDDAYDALKENHQHKVRSTIGTLAVEHGMPALRLQYPFYQITLSDRELRAFHRPAFHCKPGERANFTPNKTLKRKRFKNLKPQAIYERAEDLTLGDNSTMLLCEYSEEYPMMLSNLGMGNKYVHYYRRKDEEDNARPKHDIGETAVLLPQDQSPFSVFGYVDPGQEVPALHNSLYRAPIFRHDPRSTDFLVCRSQTGIEGSRWYLRNMENLHVVGQQLPSVEIPGTHARKVTEINKKRLKALGLRMYTKNKNRNVRGPFASNEMIRDHLPGTDIASNRSRLRDIMQYNTNTKSWEPKVNESITTEEQFRSMIKPEEICLMDAMQVGARYLADAGENTAELMDVKEGDNTNDSIVAKLVPWQITKNFLSACQGKSMVELHGEGDPTGRGEAFSFIRTSMKGGFKDVGESLEDKLDAKKIKELGGHSYNVARQQNSYDNAIKRIWTKQQESLSSTLEHSDTEMDVDHVETQQALGRGMTPRSEYGTPAAFLRDDESHISRMSNNSQSIKNKVLKITRRIRNEDGESDEEEVIVRDPKVISLYRNRRHQQQLDDTLKNIEQLRPSGNPEEDNIKKMTLLSELARLERNVERRQGREKAKNMSAVAVSNAATPGSPSAGAPKTTQRKCANCGMVGHIKTNKKLCPQLNGTATRQSDAFDSTTAFASPIAATPSSSLALAPAAGSPF
ncbi:hypothetical protein BU16DRAFT_523111 [Lophium mytilinum]|uniref:Transcription initiation factor TFIID subunit 1 histone acetyltransferase domain-containing protein n=1 Tax=Lophium mytilinum TaxID=390894 RepID=A0A6A6R8Y9_9PEZI|nr:hypothetical protein BU16DRAFT_523111 [Lophium mytilinum]